VPIQGGYVITRLRQIRKIRRCRLTILVNDRFGHYCHSQSFYELQERNLWLFGRRESCGAPAASLP
jgi:hypothetical protein